METQKINTKTDSAQTDQRKNAHLDPEYCLWADKRIRKWILNWKYFQKAETIFCFVGTAGEIHTKTADSGCFGSGKAGGCAKMHFKGDHGGTADPFSWRIVSRKLWH